MRWTGWVLAAVVIGLAGWAFGGQPGCVNCNGGLTGGPDAQPCASPGGRLVPGCGEDNPHASENVWAGYCDHRARVDAWWARLGTPAACARSRPCRQGPIGPCVTCTSCCDRVMQPVPAAVPAAPTPTRAPSNASDPRPE